MAKRGMLIRTPQSPVVDRSSPQTHARTGTRELPPSGSRCAAGGRIPLAAVAPAAALAAPASARAAVAIAAATFVGALPWKQNAIALAQRSSSCRDDLIAFRESGG